MSELKNKSKLVIADRDYLPKDVDILEKKELNNARNMLSEELVP